MSKASKAVDAAYDAWCRAIDRKPPHMVLDGLQSAEEIDAWEAWGIAIAAAAAEAQRTALAALGAP